MAWQHTLKQPVFSGQDPTLGVRPLTFYTLLRCLTLAIFSDSLLGLLR